MAKSNLNAPLTKLKYFLRREREIFRRHLEYRFAPIEWATSCTTSPLNHIVFRHRSPLIRRLRNVDMVYQYNKIDNLRIAIAHINGLKLRPGETFSFWRQVGRPSWIRGYKIGFALNQGKVIGSRGGGICQLSNLLYWMVLHTDLTIVERRRHSYDVFPDESRTVPFGGGATVAYGFADLQFCNDTDLVHELTLWTDDTYLNGEIRSDKPYLHTFKIREEAHEIRSEPDGGHSRHNRLIKEVYSADGAELIDESLVTENSARMMYNPLLEEN